MATQEEARKARTKQAQCNSKKAKTRNRNGKPRNMHRRTKKKKEKVGKKRSKEKKRNRNVHRTHGCFSRIAKPPLRLPHGTEPAKMLAHRRRPYAGRQNRRRIRCGGEPRTGCATPEPGVYSGSAAMGRAPPLAAVMLRESRLVISSDIISSFQQERKLKVKC